MSQCTEADGVLECGDGVVSDGTAAEVILLLGTWQSAAERLEEAHRAAREEIRCLGEVLAAKDAMLAANAADLAANNAELAARDADLAEKEAELAAVNAELAAKDGKLAAKDNELAAKDVELAAKDAELAQRQRLTHFGDMVAQIGQQMLDRLACVAAQLDLLERRMVNDPNGKNIAEKIATDMDRWEASLHDLIGLGLQRQPEADLLSVRDLVDSARTALKRQLAQRAVHVVVDVPEETRTVGDQRLLQRAVINLVLEALDQAPHGSDLLVAAAERLEATEVEIACDSPPGSGRSAGPRETDPSAAALRWAVVRHALEQHGGEAVAKENGAGYVLRIPHVSAEAQPSG